MTLIEKYREMYALTEGIHCEVCNGTEDINVFKLNPERDEHDNVMASCLKCKSKHSFDELRSIHNRHIFKSKPNEDEKDILYSHPDLARVLQQRNSKI